MIDRRARRLADDSGTRSSGDPPGLHGPGAGHGPSGSGPPTEQRDAQAGIASWRPRRAIVPEHPATNRELLDGALRLSQVLTDPRPSRRTTRIAEGRRVGRACDRNHGAEPRDAGRDRWAVRLSGRTYAVLVAEGVEDLEYWVTVMRLQEEGATVVSVGSDTEPHHGKNGLAVRAEATGGRRRSRRARRPGDPRRLGAGQDAPRPGDPRPGARRSTPASCRSASSATAAASRSRPASSGARATGSLGIKDDLVQRRAPSGSTSPRSATAHLVWGRVVADIPDFSRELVAAFAEAAVER